MTSESSLLNPSRSRRVFVAWQDPETNAIEPVATLLQQSSHESPRFYFSYLRRIASLVRFKTFTAFPDANQLYESDILFPFFANRLLARKRTDYGLMMEMLDLRAEAEPFEVLARSGARRATDNIEVFPEPELNPDTGDGTCMFFLRGIQYVDGSELAISKLPRGSVLRPFYDVGNPVNPKAVMLSDPQLHMLGYVSDYLVDHVRAMIDGCGPGKVKFSVEHVNKPDSPLHMRLLCRLTTCWPENYRPFSGAEYLPLASGFPVI